MRLRAAESINRPPEAVSGCGPGTIGRREMDDRPSIKEQVREDYARAARRVVNQEGSCCGTAAPAGNPITSNLYADGEIGSLPKEAVAASLGCGNPTAL